MSLRIATWNINSVRLRIGLVERLLKEWSPDVLCLQETKCPQGQFPEASLKKLGYSHIAEHGQKGYHGVAIVSRIPFTEQASMQFCGKQDCRHISITLPGKTPLLLHNYYIPAGGDEPDPKINEKFDHKLKFLSELRGWSKGHSGPRSHEAVMVGDFNVAPLESDVWSHKELLKVVSHTPIETETLNAIQSEGGWVDIMRAHVPPSEKLYTWWSYRAKDWEASNRGRRLDHVWATPDIASKAKSIEVIKAARGWQQPSDHVPVIASFDLKI